MATNHGRLPQRRTLAQRIKGDENAITRHFRSASNGVTARFTAKDVRNTKTTTTTRQALGEVQANVNRNDTGSKPTSSLLKDLKPPGSLKRGRSDSNSITQRVPLGPGRSQVAPPIANNVNVRAPPVRARITTTATKRITRIPVPTAPKEVIAAPTNDVQNEMDVEDDIPSTSTGVGINSHHATEDTHLHANESIRHEEEEHEPPAKIQRIWPDCSTRHRQRYRKEVEAVQESFEDIVDVVEENMVAEYAEEIFEYMQDLEEEMMPSADYMDNQHEITWSMRQTLVDWLSQVHLRYHMWPETLWIAVNIIDRFLSKRVVSFVKLQLVGVTAMFIAAKYEEIMAPSVDEFVFMTENGYTKEEILKGEKIMLQTLEFSISQYCSPYSWMRKISKADDYDIHTRTLSKFLTEVTLLDHRFLRAKPSLVAAVGMYTARKMLGGDWSDGFVFYSGYTEEQLMPGHQMLVEKLAENNFNRLYICKKYAHKKFLKASNFAIGWAQAYINGDILSSESMALEQ